MKEHIKEHIEETKVEKLMTGKQVADFLQVHPGSLRRWSRKGLLKFYRVGGRRDMRYQLDDVLSFLQESPVSHDQQAKIHSA